MNDNIISCSDIMMEIAGFKNEKKSNDIFSVWKSVVSKIQPRNGENGDERRIPVGLRLAKNTRVVDLKNNVLLVETDHPGWIQYLNFYKNFIIKGIRIALPELKISSLAFRVAGSQVSLSDTYDQIVEKEKKAMAEKMEYSEKILNKDFPRENLSNSNNLPPELLAKFNSIKNDMLTNSKDK